MYNNLNAEFHPWLPLPRLPPCIISAPVFFSPCLLWVRRLHSSPWVLGHPGNITKTHVDQWHLERDLWVTEEERKEKKKLQNGKNKRERVYRSRHRSPFSRHSLRVTHIRVTFAENKVFEQQVMKKFARTSSLLFILMILVHNYQSDINGTGSFYFVFFFFSTNVDPFVQNLIT